MPLEIAAPRSCWQPLDEVVVHGASSGTLSVRDGRGREYQRLPAAEGARIRLSGALGGQQILHLDEEGRVRDAVGLRVDAETGIDDGGRFHELLTYLRYTMLSTYGGRQFQLLGGKLYQHLISWLRDHTHTMKGMKWFLGGLRSGFELYAERQRSDGMILDRIFPRTPYQNWRDYTFRHGDFQHPEIEDGRGMERIPVENDVEFLFVECLYYTWKATGDSDWMGRWLDHCIKAVGYGTSDPLRWSEQYRLLKRGYTLDTWDFLSDFDVQDVVDEHGITLGNNVILPGKTHFGVFHGDNTGMAQSCRYLAEMLDHAGRGEEAERYARLGDEMQQRLDALSWNGAFYRHWVEEEPQRGGRDFGGTDTERQVTLSNAYALNRHITHEQAVAIIGSYQRIREEMPESSPGEWYNCFPPYERGFHNPKWEYMNGGVSTICAGELARGACEHGFEAYGADILQRLCDLAERHGGRLDVVFKGALGEPPQADYRCIDLGAQANTDLHGDGAEGVPGWSGDGDNDLRNLPTGRQRFGHLPFEITDPAANGRRAAIGIASEEPYAQEVRIPLGETCRSVYLLHTVAGGGIVGRLTFHYADGEQRTRYVQTGREVGSWFMPAEPTLDEGPGTAVRMPHLRLAWRGGNPVFDNVGVWAAGLDNPRPEVAIEAIVLRAPEAPAGKWFVLGLTCSDAPVWFPTSDRSYGIPDNWGAAAVVYALIEGIAGIQDAGIAMDRLRLRPRWPAAGVDRVAACARYGDSDGYASYRYRREGKALELDLASCSEDIDAALLVPEGTEVARLRIGDEEQAVAIETIEGSHYLRLPLRGLGPHRIRVDLR